MCIFSFGEKDNHDKFTWIKSTVFAFGALIKRGWFITPRKFSSRIVFIM